MASLPSLTACLGAVLLSSVLLNINVIAQPSDEVYVWRPLCHQKAKMGDDPSPFAPPEVLKTRPVEHSLTYVVLMCRTALRICNELNITIATEMEDELSTNQGKAFLNSLLSPYQNMNPLNVYLSKPKQIKRVTERSIVIVSLMRVFLELARKAGSTYERKLQEMLNKITEILCEMEEIIASLHGGLMSLGVEATSYRRILSYFEKLDEHMRNSLIVSQTYKSLHQIKGDLSDLIITP